MKKGNAACSGFIHTNGISEPEAEALPAKDVRRAENPAPRLIRAPLSDGRFDAPVSFTFNPGGGTLQRSTLRRKINREGHEEVPKELMRRVWAGGRKLKGLIRRRAAEAEPYMVN